MISRFSGKFPQSAQVPSTFAYLAVVLDAYSPRAVVPRGQIHH